MTLIYSMWCEEMWYDMTWYAGFGFEQYLIVCIISFLFYIIITIHYYTTIITVITSIAIFITHKIRLVNKFLDKYVKYAPMFCTPKMVKFHLKPSWWKIFLLFIWQHLTYFAISYAYMFLFIKRISISERSQAWIIKYINYLSRNKNGNWLGSSMDLRQ